MKTDPTWRVLSLINHDTQFTTNQSQGINPIILNHFDMADERAIEQIQDLIFSDGSGADFIAKCQCEALDGNQKIGMTCNICHTKVSLVNLLDQDHLVCKNWLAAPSELPNGWLAPKVYLMLGKWLSYNRGRRNKRNYLDDILDVEGDLPHDLEGIVTGRGWGYLYENFDRLMNYFINDHPVISKKPETTAIQVCLNLYQDRLWCHYIPILNSAINPIVSAEGAGPNKRKYSDVTADYILQAAISLSQLEFGSKRKNRQFTVEKTAYKAYRNIIAYVEEATSKYLSVKKAIPRMHLFGSRFHWSFRAVVVPIIGAHRYDELHIPWKMAVNSLRVHILGVLCREMGMDPNQASAKVRQALQIVDPQIKRIMERFIEEAPGPGIPCLWDRPPSIRDGSVMLKYWTKIDPDLENSCVGITPTTITLPNADFDGDQEFMQLV